ncbi:MAG: MarR family transcriptional regulator [Candidatus Omnitrophota bacterium]|nr:MarR family transcriptional regulator [Candidatus Omnitrophota bacterium]
MAQISLSEFADQINEYMPVIMRGVFRRNRNELFKGRISMPQFLILSFLYHQGESNMTALAKYMSVSTAAITGIADRLVRDNYAVRTYEPDDRRIIKIKLTTKGGELLKRVNGQRRQVTMRVFGKLAPSDRQDYLKIMTKIKDILSNGYPPE